MHKIKQGTGGTEEELADGLTGANSGTIMDLDAAAIVEAEINRMKNEGTTGTGGGGN